MTSSQSKSKPTSLRECRTFGDLMQLRQARRIGGVCKRCHSYNVDGWHYSTRASICTDCAEKARDELLPSVATGERKARSWIKQGLGGGNAKFIASVSGASVSFVESELARTALAKTEAR